MSLANPLFILLSTTLFVFFARTTSSFQSSIYNIYSIYNITSISLLFSTLHI